MESVGRELYNSRALRRKHSRDRHKASIRDVDTQGALQGVRAETLSRQVGTRLRRATQSFDERTGPVRVRSEPRDRRERDLRPDPMPGQVPADPLVAVTAARQRSRPSAGEPLVVDITDALERVEGFLAFVDSGAREKLVQFPPRAIAVPKRPGRDLD